MKTSLQIKSIFGKVLFEFEKEDNSIRDTLLEAIKSGAYLSCAHLYGANLSGADLYGANLSGADLSGTHLSGAYLSCAHLYGTNLSGAHLYGANLSGANLYGANLSGANLSGANLSGANLSGADLSGTHLSGTNLSGAHLYGVKIDDVNSLKKYFWIIPEEGSFIAWKKCINAIVKLQIPVEAKRTCNLKSRKCRAEYVKVLSIWDMEGHKLTEVIGSFDKKTKYEVGKITYPDKYDDSMLEDCSNGIHFFITRQEAENYL